MLNIIYKRINRMSEIKVKFIVSEGVESRGNGFQSNQAIVNPLLSFNTKYIPTSLSLAITIVTSDIPEGKHVLNLKIYDCTKGVNSFDSGNSEFELEGGLDNFGFSFDLKNIGFESAGAYKMVFSIGDESFEDLFYVKKED